MLFAIFTFELTYISGVFGTVNEDLKLKDIREFNTQFEAYANKEIGYANIGDTNIKNTISMQEFASIYNLVQDWNNTYPSDKIDVTIEVVGTMPPNTIKNGKLHPDYKNNLEKLFTNLDQNGGLENYYFEFIITHDNYNEERKNKYFKLHNAKIIIKCCKIKYKVI